jgi:iron complex outermembrane receptor protein
MLPVAVLLALLAAGSQARPSDPDVRSLAELSLEELMQVEVGIVSGRPQSRVASPAALVVITAEDVRRSGHASVVEALRLVPGMYVGQVSASSWVAGARGLTGSSLTATRYLVMVDGRVVHDPLLSITFWDVVDIPLTELDRIEVIRGPGASLWGLNAMNGVVNIITRHARHSTGTLLQAGGGNHLHGHLLVRHGGGGGQTWWRAWAKHDRFGDLDTVDGAPAGDEWSRLRAGFRLDHARGDGVELTLSGAAYTHPRAMVTARLPVPGRHQEFVTVRTDDSIAGAHLLASARSNVDQGHGWSVHAWYDHSRRSHSRFGVERDTVELDYRRWLRWGGASELLWGGTWNWTSDQVDSGPVLLMEPASRDWHAFNLFVQNTTELVPGRWFAMVGSKLSHHAFIDLQLQPSLRVWWTPDQRQTLWAALSRPVRVPSRFEVDGLLVFSYADSGLLAGGPPSGVIVPVGLGGDGWLEPETMLAWELGHRIRFSERWALDTTLFYNDYTRLIGVPPEIVGHFLDSGTAETWGATVALSARLTPRWRMEASWSALRVEVSGPVLPFEEDSAPRTLAQLRSYLDLGEDWELNGAAYYTDAIPFREQGAYTRLDLGLTWRATPRLALALWGQNLLDQGHPEGSDALVPRTLYAEATLRLGD